MASNSMNISQIWGQDPWDFLIYRFGVEFQIPLFSKYSVTANNRYTIQKLKLLNKIM
jgi:hypothetical protein